MMETGKQENNIVKLKDKHIKQAKNNMKCIIISVQERHSNMRKGPPQCETRQCNLKTKRVNIICKTNYWVYNSIL